jgi:hypothetical protein
MENEDPKETAQEQMTPRGRDKFMEMMKAKNADYNPENDDQFLDDAHSMYSERDMELGKHKEANSKLAGLVGKDPKLGAVLGMIAGEDQKSFPYAVGKVYGKEAFEMDEDALEEFEKGYQEHLTQIGATRAAQEEASKNIQEFVATFEKYISDNKLSEQEAEGLYEKINGIADNMLMGIIPADIIELIHKGLNHDQDVQEAADTGMVEGRNQKIEAKIATKKEAVMPDMATNTGAGKTKTLPKSDKKDFYSNF